MTQFDTVNYSVNQRVATISLNRPQALNAFTSELRLDLLAALNQANNDDEVRVIILTGEGRGFCSGADLTEEKKFPSFVEECEAEYKPFLMAIHDSPKLVIASVNGVAAGIGAALVMLCDLIVMSEEAYLYQAFAAIGLMPDGGATQLLLNRLGYYKALEMVVDAGKLTAQECLEQQIANKVVAADDLQQVSQEWALKLAEGAPISQRFTKQLMRKVSQMDYSQVVDEEAKLQAQCIDSEDAKVGITAFLNKTKPTFTGR